MSKFCSNCGFAAEDSANVCGNCGTPFAATTTQPNAGEQPYQQPYQPYTPPVTPAPAGNNKKIGIIAVAAVTVIALVIILCVVLGKSSGYKGAVKKYMNAIENCDVDTMVALTLQNAYAEQDDEEEWEDSWDSWLDYIEDQYGDHLKVTYEFKKEKEYSEKKLDDYRDEAEDNWDDVDGDDITKVVEVKLDASIEGEDDDDEDTMELLLVKYQGKWYVSSY